MSYVTRYFITLRFLLIIAASLPTLAYSQTISSALNLYGQGKIESAKKEFQLVLAEAEKNGKPAEIWNTLIGFAWFLDEIGEHRQAIEQSNRALEIASQSENRFMIGRSLSWLGWAYTGLGLYELALDFYKNAVEVAAPKGKVEILHVWGLSTQEIGALYYKMGRLKDGRKYLEEALQVAREKKVGPGISEGAAHLAELSLTEGKFEEAETLAREAVTFGQTCDHGCTPYNTVHAQVVLAKVLLEKARLDPGRMPMVLKEIQTTIEASKKAGLKRCEAEAKLLLSKTFPASQFETRYALVTEAFEILASMESELRGTAESELGKLYLENGDLKLAEFYLKNGFKVNKELFRKVDNAYVQGDIAQLTGLKGDAQRALQQLKKTADAAVATNNFPLASETLAKLAPSYLSFGYAVMALKSAKQGLEIIDKLLEHSEDEAIRNTLRVRKVELSVVFAEASLKLSNTAGSSAPPAS